MTFHKLEINRLFFKSTRMSDTFLLTMTDDGTCKGPFMLAMIKNLMSPVFKMQAWFSTFAFGSGDEKRE